MTKKTYLLVIVAICFSILACKKNESISPGLFGKWELRSVHGSLNGSDSTYKAGNGTIYQFNSDSTYKYYVKNKLTARGTFRIIYYYPPSGNSFEEILFDNNTSGELFSLNGTKLSIDTRVTDGIDFGYEKIPN
jgi:hypothetical protein